MRHNHTTGLRAMDAPPVTQPASPQPASDLEGFDMSTTAGNMAAGMPEPHEGPDPDMVALAIESGISPEDAKQFWGV